MRLVRWAQRHMGLWVLMGMAGFAVFGYAAIRRDVESLRIIGQDNILWTANQVEVELLRFQLAVADAAIAGTPQAIAIMRERFDILWSRIALIGSGRIGAQIARYDEGVDAIGAFRRDLEALDPMVARIRPGDVADLQRLLDALAAHQREIRLFSLRVVRGDTAAAADLRARIQVGAQATAATSIATILLSALALALIMRDNRRQRDMAEFDRRAAQEAEAANRAKSRFLGMMSHELRNPLNGVLGPLALLGQSNLAPRDSRLVEQAQQSGRAMLQLLAGLLDYGELQDGRLQTLAEPFRLKCMVDDVRAELAAAGRVEISVSAEPADVDFAVGDPLRLRRIFVNLVEYVIETADPANLELVFSHDGAALTGEIRFTPGAAAPDWSAADVTGPGKADPDAMSGEALRPLIARGLIAAAQGTLALADAENGAGAGAGGRDSRRVLRVTIPAARVGRKRIRVVVDTRSEALAAIYRAALRSERVCFVDPCDVGPGGGGSSEAGSSGGGPSEAGPCEAGQGKSGPVDLVLVDAANGAEAAGMARLRRRFPSAMLISLGATERPDCFDDVVESPADMTRLRARLLGEPV